ncbi:MAG: DEAD/DEAH box helicase [bacterium]
MELTPIQQNAIDFLYEHDASFLVAPTGEGKTVIALTAMRDLIRDVVKNKFIVAAPPKVMSVWPDEQRKWPHLSGLRVQQIVGDVPARLAKLAHYGDADVLVISLPNLHWLLQQRHGADGIYIDEISKAAGKQTRGLRSKKLSDMLTWRCGAAAEPVSQNFEKLYAMCRVVDKGKSLGTSKDRFMKAWFDLDYNGYDWTLREGSDVAIMNAVAPLIFLIENKKAEKLPPLKREQIRFHMRTDTRLKYDLMKKEFMVEEEDDEGVVAISDAIKSTKLRQIASGFGYRQDGMVDVYDSARAWAFHHWYEVLAERRGIVAYEYTEQRENIMEVLGEGVEVTEDVEAFKRGEGQLLVAQIGSLSHGVEGLQHVCSNLCIYQPNWSRDTTEQIIGRVWRQGTPAAQINVTTLVCEQTLDDVALARVAGNGRWMEMLEAHLRSAS